MALTVAELIEVLVSCPGDAQVDAWCPDEEVCYEVTGVREILPDYRGARWVTLDTE